MIRDYIIVSSNPVAVRKRVVAQRIISGLVDEVSRETGIDRADILSRCRKQRFVKARWMVMRRARRHCLSSGDIGRAMGLDHSTVLYGQKIKGAKS